MNRRKIISTLLYVIALAVVVAAAIAYYLFNKPHRNVADADTDFRISATALVEEYLQSAEAANQKYLADDGESKILAVTGKVATLVKDLNGQSVITLRSNDQKAGVSCTFTLATNKQTEHISPGDVVTVKGVIRSGAGYDSDLDLYEDVILEKCSIDN